MVDGFKIFEGIRYQYFEKWIFKVNIQVFRRLSRKRIFISQVEDLNQI